MPRILSGIFEYCNCPLSYTHGFGKIFAMKNKTLLFGACVALIAGMVPATAAFAENCTKDAATYRFVTWNIWGWGENVGYTPDKREAKAIQAARAWNADVIAIQEVSPNWWKSAFFKELAQDYGVVDGGDWNGVKHNPNPLMYRKSRLELLFSGRECYHFKLDYSKGYTWAAFKDKVTGAKFITYSTHYWWKETGAESAYIRYVNSQRLIEGMERLRSILPVPVIGGGDFNCRVGTDALQILQRHGYSDAQKAAAKVVRDCTTWHDYPVKGADGVFRGAFPEKGNTLANALDHVFADGCVNLLRHEVDAAADALDVSDHCPVIVDFSLKVCPQKK